MPPKSGKGSVTGKKGSKSGEEKGKGGRGGAGASKKGQVCVFFVISDQKPLNDSTYTGR